MDCKYQFFSLILSKTGETSCEKNRAENVESIPHSPPLQIHGHQKILVALSCHYLDLALGYFFSGLCIHNESVALNEVLFCMFGIIFIEEKHGLRRGNIIIAAIMDEADCMEHFPLGRSDLQVDLPQFSFSRFEKGHYERYLINVRNLRDLPKDICLAGRVSRRSRMRYAKRARSGRERQ